MGALISYQVIHQVLNWANLPERRIHWVGNEKLPGKPEGSKFEIRFAADNLTRCAAKFHQVRRNKLTVADVSNYVQSAFCGDFVVCSLSYEDNGAIMARVWYRPDNRALTAYESYGEPDSNAYRQYQHDNAN